MLRAEVLKLYKQMLRLVRKIPDQNQRQQLQNFIRQDFELNKSIEDEVSNYAYKVQQYGFYTHYWLRQHAFFFGGGGSENKTVNWEAETI